MRITALFRLMLTSLLAAGLLISAAPKPAHAQHAGEPVMPALHVVGWGETLATISADYGISAERIITANDLDQPDLLYVGVQLVIPNALPLPAPSAQNGTHTVQRGETLFRIALNYGLTVDELKAANGLPNDLIYAGQMLIIPAPGTAAATPPSSGNTGSGIHVVQPGETLMRISQRYGVSMQALISANGLINPSVIYAGQTLVIPGPNAPSGNTPPAATQPVSGSHIVQAGETLGAIAQRYGVSIAALVQANAISNPSLIYVGQSLVIPGGGTSSGPATQPNAPGTHVVQRGETLFRIATNYGITVSALMSANGLSSSIIYTGQVLNIPSGGSAAPQPDPGAGSAPNPTVPTGKQIVIVLSQQTVYAYENGQLLRQFVVSTGLPATPTVQGDFAIYLKYEAQRMTGPDYDLPGVPWVMYFYQGYGLHGTYWHNNFGQPMSHGCVNMRTEEAEWMYYWAPVGTPVRVVWS